ncbi:MAG: transporter substrate-binding domain-containing protein [Oscillospiraceae bacterium]|jgi:polar amino acid transport system substrate-binding protein|nr:transporter substrate-binding domain-containing protein [Oscillospiraceae bacterium]
MKRIASFLSLILIMVLLGGVAMADEAKTYVIGTNAEFPPFEYIDDEGNFAGFDMELVAMLLDRIGVAYTYETMEFNALIPALASDRIDIAAAAITIREDRLENALFSDPYFHATQKIIVAADNEAITTEADLAGKKIGVQMGTTGDLYITDIADYAGTIEVERFSKALDAVMDLATGRLDAVVVDEGVSAYFIEAVEGLRLLDDVLSDEYYGIAMKLGEDEFMAKINAALAEMMEDGSYDELFGKYFASDDEGEAAAE